ncbi:MAG: PAS domain-containing protein [Steroidobacteraceae bacterium]|nr:PAS domain-containing protein [Deltaproteobacteria bacterium]
MTTASKSCKELQAEIDHLRLRLEEAKETSTDFSERRQAEEALRAAHERINTILDQMSDGFASCDREWRYTYINAAAAKAYQMPPEQLLGKNIWEMWPAAYDLPLGINFRRSMQENIPVQFETYYPAPLDRWFECRCHPTTVGLAVFFSDITERKLADEKLQKAHDELEQRVAERTEELAMSVKLLQDQIVERERAEKSLCEETAQRLRAMENLCEKEQMLIQQSRQAAMGEMIGNIAHQWRQPLNTLGLKIQTLQLFYGHDEFTKEFLETSVSSSMELIQHMSKTIDDFRNYFRPDKKKIDFNVHEAIDNSLSLLEGSLQNPPISIEIVAKDRPVVHGYQNEFAQALLNILLNARDAFIEREIDEPKVTITISNEDGCSVITVADNAGGIPEEIMGKIFEPYFTTKGPQQGTGVGLFMSKTIIEKNMGGRLDARNIANGAEFRVKVCNGIRI